MVAQEWADYSSEVLPWIEEDRQLDGDSKYPNEHHFEKMTSGLYMGDLARRILLTCARPSSGPTLVEPLGDSADAALLTRPNRGLAPHQSRPYLGT